MKKCPFCAELIQDEAVFCRYCHKDLPAPAEDGKFQELATQPTLHSTYEILLATLRAAKPQDLRTYPLSPQRRSKVIATVVEQLEKDTVDGKPFVLLHHFWWHTGIDKKSAPPYDWRQKAQDALGLQPTDSIFPTEDEWLSAIALLLRRAQEGGYLKKLYRLDHLAAWQMLQRAKRADRILGSLTALGAASTLLTSLLPSRPPKEGSQQWHICRRAYAELEAATVCALLKKRGELRSA